MADERTGNRKGLWWGVLMLSLTAVLLACSQKKTDEPWSVTGTFEVPVTSPDGTQFTYTMRGAEGQYAFIDAPFVAGKGQKYMWHFWGKPEDYAGKSLEVKATHRDGRTIEVWSGGLAGANNGAVAHMPSSMSLPSPGLWRLDVRVGGQLIGHIVVEASEVELRVRNANATFPEGCGPNDVLHLVEGFLDAFSQGDQDRLTRFFGPGFQVFSVTMAENDHVAIYDTADLPAYFAARHVQREILSLQKLEVASGSWHGGIDIVFNIRRSANDLGTVDVGGKGMVKCENRTISVWSMGRGAPLK
ncbi:MAG TPA: hypothetical protein VD902_02405 [Symbiobacteriaceae bacterium]|nr:hypothetical protein [Symbiobacteriaceae bacterium]